MKILIILLILWCIGLTFYCLLHKHNNNCKCEFNNLSLEEIKNLLGLIEVDLVENKIEKN